MTIQNWTSDADAGCIMEPAMHACEDQAQVHRFATQRLRLSGSTAQTKERKTFGLGEKIHARGLAEAEHLTKSAVFSNSF